MCSFRMPLETDRKLVGIGLEILVPISISREPLEAFLRASGYSQTELAEKWYKSKSDELAYVGVTVRYFYSFLLS